jgi:hypothetical protein
MPRSFSLRPEIYELEGDERMLMDCASMAFAISELVEPATPI